MLNDAFGGSHGRQVLSAWEYPKEGAGFTPCINSIGHTPGNLPVIKDLNMNWLIFLRKFFLS